LVPCSQCLTIVPFLDVAEQTIYAIKDAAAHLRLLRRDSQLVVCAPDIAETTVKFLNSAGIFGVEMFPMTDNQILVNEITSRPDMAWQLAPCQTSPYEGYLRAIVSLPICSTALCVQVCSCGCVVHLSTFATRLPYCRGAHSHLTRQAQTPQNRRARIYHSTSR